MDFEHYDKCSLLLPMDGANNGTTFTDWSPNPKTVSAFGNAKTVTSQSKYYGSSGYFDGTGDYLTSPYSAAAFHVSNGDFTFGAWINPANASNRYILLVGSSSTDRQLGIYIAVDGVLSSVFQSGASTFQTNAGTVPLSTDTFQYVAVTKSGDTVRHFIDGILEDSFTYSATVQSSTPTAVYIGRIPYATTYDFSGYIQDLLFIKEAALWTDDFTPPTRLIGELSNTSALVPVEDESGDPVERTIIAVPRCYPTRAFGTASDSNGEFTMRAPATECSVIAIHEGDPIKNDLIARVIPA